MTETVSGVVICASAPAQAERLQDVEAGLHLLHRIGGERDADGVPDSRPEKRADADRRFDRAHAQGPGLGDAEMERVIAGLGEALIGGDREEHVGGLAGYLEFEEVVVLEDARMGERAFDHRLRARLAVFLQ
jgi:hypothetical protein